jgi:DNA polymerase-1
MQSHKPIILIDGSSYLYRAFHALPPLITTKGQPTGAIYGVIKMIKKLIKTYQPENIAVIFDTKKKTFRDDLYSEYKATRKAMPDELQSQIDLLYQLITAIGLKIILIDGVEADDVIATLAKKFSSTHPILISTGDKDMAQLVDKNINLINTMNDYLYTEKSVEEKFGVKPSQIIDYLTLTGDTSDNIPGVAGVGPKTAAKWLSEYGSLNNLIQHRHEIKGKITQAFEQAMENFPLTQQLVILKSDVPEVGILELADLKPFAEDKEKLIQLLKELEFKSWLSELLTESTSEPSSLTNDNPRKKHHKAYRCILDLSDFNQLISTLKNSKLFALDTETTSLNIINAELVGLSFSFEGGEAYYLPIAHNYIDAPVQLKKEIVLEKLKPLLENPDLIKIGHHIKYDINILKNVGIDLQGVKFDTLLESYLLDSAASRHDMDTLALKYLHKKTIHFEDIAGKGAKQITFNQINIDVATEYSAEDADITYQLHECLFPKLKNDAGLLNIFDSIEMPLILVLAKMERTGVLIDANLLKNQSHYLADKIAELEKKAYQETGKVFNLSSPKQLQEILFQQLKLPIVEKTPTGQPSTSENVLQDLALNYEFPKIILEHRTLSKLKSTYTDKLPEEINAKTKRIHTSYHQAGTSTGRLSSSNPNLQNIPIRTEEGRNIRKAFIAPKGYKIVSADYSQIELRLMAHLSQDTSLLKSFELGLDIHTSTASEIFNTPLTEVSSEQRRRAKAVNFGLIYGMSSFGLAKQLGVDRTTAQEYIDIYFARFPKVKEYMAEMKKLAHQQGYVTTLNGRKLNLPEINARNIMRQRASERAAINAPLQGTAADLIKIAMINIHHAIESNNIPAKMLMQVHDELIFEVLETDLEPIKNQIKDLMENAMKLSVPLIVSIGVGNNWDEAH